MLANGKDAVGGGDYERHCPERALLYQLVEAHFPTLVDQLALQGKSMPEHVLREFETYLKCGRLEHGFLRVRCDKCQLVTPARRGKGIKSISNAEVRTSAERHAAMDQASPPGRSGSSEFSIGPHSDRHRSLRPLRRVSQNYCVY